MKLTTRTLRCKVALIAAVAVLPLRAAESQSMSAQADSAAIVRAAWEVATRDARRASLLWTPLPADTERVVPISAEVRNALTRERIPVADQSPAGSDTVVYRISSWRTDSSGVILQFSSRWTEVIGQGARRCRAASGNVERFRVRRELGTWIAERLPPIMHGDGMCVRIHDE